MEVLHAYVGGFMASSYVISAYVISTTATLSSLLCTSFNAWTTALHRPHRDISLTLMTSPLTCISPGRSSVHEERPLLLWKEYAVALDAATRGQQPQQRVDAEGQRKVVERTVVEERPRAMLPPLA